MSKNDLGFVYMICKKRDIHELKVSCKQLSTNSLSMPSAQETVLRQ